MERTVGAASVAARGLSRGSGNERLEFGEHLSKPRAATEGRPYSTFRVASRDCEGVIRGIQRRHYSQDYYENESYGLIQRI